MEARKQLLQKDITVITSLLEEWDTLNDPQVQWVTYVLVYCRGQCQRDLERLNELNQRST